MNDRQEGYVETRDREKMLVSWDAGVILYARKMMWYAFLFGFALWTLTSLTRDQALPDGAAAWAWLLITGVMGGLVVGSLFAGVALVIKDLFYPYRQPSQTVRQLPRMAAPPDAKPRPLSRIMDNGAIYYGMEKLEPERWLALARALVERGERQISRRKLQEWGVVDDRLGPVAKQLIVDLNTLHYVEGRGNDLYEATEALVNHVADMFPALQLRAGTPLP